MDINSNEGSQKHIKPKTTAMIMRKIKTTMMQITTKEPIK